MASQVRAATGALGLDVEAVEPAGRVRRRHDAARGDGLLPASGLETPVPWISAMVLSTGSPGGGPAPAGPRPSGVGVAGVKSVELMSVSAPSARCG